MNKSREFIYISYEQVKYENIDCPNIDKKQKNGTSLFFEYQYNNNTKERLRIITPILKSIDYIHKTGRIKLNDTDAEFLKPFFDNFYKWFQKQDKHNDIEITSDLRLIQDKSKTIFTKVIKYNVHRKYEPVEIFSKLTHTTISKMLSKNKDYRMILQPRIYIMDEKNAFLHWQIYIMEISYPDTVFESVIDKNSQELVDEINMIEI